MKQLMVRDEPQYKWNGYRNQLHINTAIAQTIDMLTAVHSQYLVQKLIYNIVLIS